MNDFIIGVQGRSRRAGLFLLWVRRARRRSFCFPAWLSFPGTLFAKRFREWGARGRLSPALVQQGQNFLKILRRGRHGEAKGAALRAAFIARVVLFAKENMLCAEPRGECRGRHGKAKGIFSLKRISPLEPQETTRGKPLDPRTAGEKLTFRERYGGAWTSDDLVCSLLRLAAAAHLVRKLT